MTLSEKLLISATEIGACEECIKKWDVNWQIHDLLLFYKENPNWCMEHHFPAIELLKKYNDHKSDIFVDESVAIQAENPCYLFINCIAGISTTAITRFYFSLNSKAKIVVKEHGFLMADIYDNTYLEIELRQKAKCVINQYGINKPVVIGESKNFKIKNRQK